MKRIVPAIPVLLLALVVPLLAAGDRVLHLADADFKAKTKGAFLIVDFWATWCGPCKEFAPVFDEVAGALAGIPFAKVDTDQAPRTVNEMGVTGIPCVLAIRNGKQVAKYEGDRSAEDFAAWCRTQFARHGTLDADEKDVAGLPDRVQRLGDDDFYSATDGKLAIVDFHSGWAEVCNRFVPVFVEVGKRVPRGLFVLVDTEKSPTLMADFAIRHAPYVVAVKGRKVVARYEGDLSMGDFLVWCRKQLAAR